MKKFIALCLILFVAFCIFSSSVALTACAATSGNSNAQTADNTIMLNSSHGLDAGSALLGTQKLVDNAKAAVLYESGSETLMYAFNADERMHPASFVKIMTALIAAEKGNMTDTVTVSQGAVSSLPKGAVSADLTAGEELALADLLYCLLVGSANDAAAVIAEHIGGSEAAFVQIMNQYAQDLGCTGTQFTNAHGLHNDAQYTTARDAARILDAAMKNDVFRSVFTSVKHTVAATNKSEKRDLISGNFMVDTSSKLYYDSRVIGGRTGVTEDGRRCLATAAEKNGMLLICIVMGSDTVYQEDGYSAITVGGYLETTALLNAGFEGHKAVQILYENQALKQYPVSGGDSHVVVGPMVSVSAVLPETVTLSDLSMRYSDEMLQVPIKAGDKVSMLQIWHGNMCIAQVDLVAFNSVATAGSVQLSDASKVNSGIWNWVIWVIVAVLICILVIFAVLVIIRKMRVLAVRKRSKRYRRSRRRSR